MTAPDPARNRFIVIQLMRLSGVAMVMFGLAILSGKTDLPLAAGYVLSVVGMFDAMVVPLLLSRRWKSPKE